MADVERDVPDAPGCPLLGLAVDHRSRYTFPHPGHRCFAGPAASLVEAHHQATYCLSRSFASCERYQAWQRTAEAGERHKPPAADITSVIHVFRPGDSLVRIAAAYGVTADEIVTANGLASADSAIDGQRLVIPLGRRPDRAPGGEPSSGADMSS